jgi:hypothetical protein
MHYVILYLNIILPDGPNYQIVTSCQNFQQSFVFFNFSKLSI